MAQLIPPVNFDDGSFTGTYSEQLALETLRDQLTKDVRVYHSVEMLWRERVNDHGAATRLREGESDAIVLFPDNSLVVVEVKGKDFVYNSDTREWQLGKLGTPNPISKKDPFDQARGNKYNLIKHLEKVIGQQGKVDSRVKRDCRFAYAVLFPLDKMTGQLPVNADESILFDANKLSDLGRLITTLANKAGGHSTSSQNNDALTSADVHHAICGSLALVPCLNTEFKGLERSLLRLTEQQKSAFELIAGCRRALVHGVAGSGKTVLATEQARRFAEQGLCVLLLSFNDALGNMLAQRFVDEEFEGSIEASSFHDFCKRHCLKEGMDFDPGDDPQTFYYDIAPDMLSQIARLKHHYDAIIVDEGQDFRELWWMALQDCLKPDGRLFVFSDPQQDIFSAGGLSALDMGDNIYNLNQNCRNAKGIAEFCQTITPTTSVSLDNAASGGTVTEQVLTSSKKRIEHIHDLLNQYVLDNKICSSRIAILSPFRPANTCLADGFSTSRLSLTQNFEDWRNGDAVLQTTIKAFKGLEADIVFLIDIPVPDTHPAFTSNDFYVGASRARSILHVFAKEVAPRKNAA